MPESPVMEKRGALWVGRFDCMASPCEVLIECDDEAEARALARVARREAERIERKFSRYRDDNIVHAINRGGTLEVDAETARLLDFAQRCYTLSDGLFDITSGVLRAAWRYGPGAVPPSRADIEALLPRIGWHKVGWDPPRLTLPAGMEIDFGGIGKEYAVDAVSNLLRARSDRPLLVNFGGDCHASGPRGGGATWITGIEDPRRPGDATAVIRLARGALATSGDVFKFVERDGVRYGHILDPKTGWPVAGSPLSVTVAAATCSEAGVLSTLAMLQGVDAESFLDRQGARYWCYR